jgi:hypothetical protein
MELDVAHYTYFQKMMPLMGCGRSQIETYGYNVFQTSNETSVDSIFNIGTSDSNSPTTVRIGKWAKRYNQHRVRALLYI